MPANNHSEIMELAHQWGFKTSPHQAICKNSDEILSFINHWDRTFNLPFDIDGIVIKVNNIAQQEELGYTRPIVGPFPINLKPNEACSQLLSVTYQVGRTVSAYLRPKTGSVSGTVVKRIAAWPATMLKGSTASIQTTMFMLKKGAK